LNLKRELPLKGGKRKLPRSYKSCFFYRGGGKRYKEEERNISEMARLLGKIVAVAKTGGDGKRDKI